MPSGGEHKILLEVSRESGWQW